MAAQRKPSKPHRDFPLTPHNNGRWCKKIKGKIYYFGLWDDPQGALQEYLQQKDFILAGRQAPLQGISVYEVLDRFVAARRDDVDCGDLSERTWKDYQDNCQLILRHLDHSMPVESLMPEDLQSLRNALMQGVSPVTAGNRIRMAKTALRYIEVLNPKFQMNFGKWFRQPSAKSMRRSRVEAGPRMHSSTQIRAAVRDAGVAMKAMLLLGINCAFGNSDCSRITWEPINLETGWHTYHREKTYATRKAKLWPETIEALQNIPENRRGRVFVTKYDNPWSPSAISQEARKLGIEFYNLRRTFRTVADATQELTAVRLIMGHAQNRSNMDHVYVQHVLDKRLEAVSDFVREWYLS